ncbi:phytanoyl-CoA dioxygenase family protein [Curvivirga sp.]|uniref:phytanoyl-CoA dioxygenase family protein n=1 Tax=Curvivirga sp. TaxID=2856848 RepID=UPI003B5B3A92
MKLSTNQMSKEYWEELNPLLSIGRNYSEKLDAFLSDEMLDSVSESLNRDGYFTLPSVISDELVCDLRHAMMNLKQVNIPPAYIYVYDQAWFLFASVSKLLSRFLGEEHVLLPNFWAWHLETAKGAAGWPPHQDCQAETSFQIEHDSYVFMSLSLWIPLNDTDEDNGCMMVLPRPVADRYEPPITDVDQVGLEDGKALPAKAGSVMGWAQDIYHWSSCATGLSDTPRISLSLEFQNPVFDPLATPWLNARVPVSFEERLEIIALQFKKYSHMTS